MVNVWSETSLPTLLHNYDLKDNYNADEYGLFYQCVPNKSYQLKSEKCSGGKLSKVRIAGMTSANAAGGKLPMFVIGKARKFLPFVDIDIKRRAGWMDGILFEEWVRELDWKFLSVRRNFALVIDNCPAHPHIENLKAIKLFFLPQPMDKV